MQRKLFLAIRRIEEGLALLDAIGMGASMSAIHAQSALDYAKRLARGRRDEGNVHEPTHHSPRIPGNPWKIADEDPV